VSAAGADAGWAAADIADAEALGGAIRRMAEHTGRVDVLHFNPSVGREASTRELTARSCSPTSRWARRVC
jgi:NAD(P)-dependent dehydrogenase (short-subunit alcohol dehydrogenase family)